MLESFTIMENKDLHFLNMGNYRVKKIPTPSPKANRNYPQNCEKILDPSLREHHK